MHRPPRGRYFALRLLLGPVIIFAVITILSLLSR